MADDKAKAEDTKVKKPAEEVAEEVVKDTTDRPEADAPEEFQEEGSDEGPKDTPKRAKAGKRSAKAVKETEEKEAKEERKEKLASGELEEEEPKKKGPTPKTRPLIERRSKGYRKAAEQVKADKSYSINEAADLATKTSPVKFDATVEMHIKLGVDPKQADQNIRESIVLPNGTGKDIRIAVLAPENEVEAIKKAGADKVGEDSLLDDLGKGILDFDVLIAPPQLMAKLGRHAKTLGPKGLMPNPKSGTVTKNLIAAVKEAKAGRVELRVDDYGNVHTGIGKVSFGGDKLAQNAEAVMESIQGAKPSSIKGIYIENVVITTSMGPSIRVTL